MDSSLSSLYTLTARLERFEDHVAVLRNDAVGEFRWPIKNLPDQVKVGDTVTLKVSTGKTEEEEKYTHMKKLLEELIN